MSKRVVRVFAGNLMTLPDGAHARAIADPSLTIWRLGDGSVVASDDACPHYFWSLHTVGEVDGCVLTCGAHDARFDLRTGAVLEGPSRSPLTVYEVEISESGDIFVLRTEPAASGRGSQS